MVKNGGQQDLSIFISLLLRHKPEAAGIKLDKYGFAIVDELIEGINSTGRKIDLVELERIVEEDSKQRYRFNECKSKIRANQGHSIKVQLDLEERIPPDKLYHGTADKFIGSIKSTGINKRSRQYVHLSKDKDTALNVGNRHGNAVILSIDSKKMVMDGYKFYISENNVWLTDNIPNEYIDWKCLNDGRQ